MVLPIFQEEVHTDMTKASFLNSPTLRYVHGVMARSFSWQASNTSVVGRQELLFLHSLTKHHPLHLRYVLAKFIIHQGKHTLLGTIFVRPYITRLIRGVGLMDWLEGQEVVGSMTSHGMDTLHYIGMITRRGSRHILTSRPSVLLTILGEDP